MTLVQALNGQRRVTTENLGGARGGWSELQCLPGLSRRVPPTNPRSRRRVSSFWAELTFLWSRSRTSVITRPKLRHPFQRSRIGYRTQAAALRLCDCCHSAVDTSPALLTSKQAGCDRRTQQSLVCHPPSPLLVLRKYTKRFTEDTRYLLHVLYFHPGCSVPHNVEMIEVSQAFGYAWLCWGSIVLVVQSIGTYGMYVQFRPSHVIYCRLY